MYSLWHVHLGFWKGIKNMKFSERDLERNLTDFSREVLGDSMTFQKAVISGLFKKSLHVKTSRKNCA